MSSDINFLITAAAQFRTDVEMSGNPSDFCTHAVGPEDASGVLCGHEHSASCVVTGFNRLDRRVSLFLHPGRLILCERAPLSNEYEVG